jgi:hypothetical protein
MKHPAILLLAGISAVLSACAPLTPQVRIQSNPQLYAALSPQHQALVSQGQIDRGMGPEAVFLAWGKADSIFEGSRGAAPVQRWDYTGTRPVQTTSFVGAYGFGRYGRGYGFGAGPEIAYIPYRTASVWFESNRVTAWERLR